jgi:hypothetical protein
LWSYDGTLDRIHHALHVACREQGEREASPTAAIVDSQSVKSAVGAGITHFIDHQYGRTNPISTFHSKTYAFAYPCGSEIPQRSPSS